MDVRTGPYHLAENPTQEKRAKEITSQTQQWRTDYNHKFELPYPTDQEIAMGVHLGSMTN